MTQNSRINRFFQFMVILFYIGYGVSCGILYYRQSIQMGGNYYSDLVAHIRSGVYGEGGYSIAYKILGMFYKISGDTRLVAVLDVYKRQDWMFWFHRHCFRGGSTEAKT